MSVNIKNGIAVINKQKQLTNKQLAKLNFLDSESREKYLKSILGVSKDYVNTNEFFKTGHEDVLENKQKNGMYYLFRDLLNNSENTLHTPKIRNKFTQWIGLEIECLIKRNAHTDCELCNGRGIYEDDDGNEEECSCGSESERAVHRRVRDRLKFEKISNCSVKHDGSLTNNDRLCGTEVTMLFNAKSGFEKVQKLCKTLNDLDARVDESCGLHVHLDCYNIDTYQAKKKGRIFGQFIPILFKMVPSSRRNSNYCLPVVSNISNGSRYCAINMTAYAKFKTIEVRLHSGTTNAKKIEHWIRLLLAIYNLESVPTNTVNTFQDLLDTLPELPNDTITYLESRYEKFSSTYTDNEKHGESISNFENPYPIIDLSLESIRQARRDLQNALGRNIHLADSITDRGLFDMAVGHAETPYNLVLEPYDVQRLVTQIQRNTRGNLTEHYENFIRAHSYPSYYYPRQPVYTAIELGAMLNSTNSSYDISTGLFDTVVHEVSNV